MTPTTRTPPKATTKTKTTTPRAGGSERPPGTQAVKTAPKGLAAAKFAFADSPETDLARSEDGGKGRPLWERVVRLAARLADALPAWARDWRFWLVFAMGAALRLVAIGRSPFDSDDALLFLEAARAAGAHLLPGTGIYSSLLALNPPAYTFLLLPFALDPLGMAILTALVNVAAVAGLYLFAAHHFGRNVALVGGLFFATAPYDTWMSEFVWQQTIVIPLLLAALALAYEGAVRGKRWWLVPHAALVLLAIQIYPLAAAFLAVTLVAMLLAWRTVRLGSLALVVLVSEVLFLPTILFELASGGYDLPIYAQWLAAPKHTDLAGFAALTQALGPQARDFFGTNTWYYAVAPGFAWLTPVIVILWLAATAWLAMALVVPLAVGCVRATREHKRASLGAALRERRWRARLLLLPFPLALLAATTHHASPVYVHYLFVLTPLIYLTIGDFLTSFPAQVARGLRSLRVGAFAGAVASGLAGFASGALLAAQFVVTSVLILTVALGQASAGSWGHIPTASFARAMSLVSAAAARTHAGQVFIAGDPGDPYLAQYWAEQQNALAGSGGPVWTAYVADGCALTPAASPHHAPALVLATAAAGPALLAALSAPGARFIQRIPMARDAAYTLYELPPDPPSTADQVAEVNGELRLNAAAVGPGNTAGQTLFMRWTVLAGTPPGPAVAQYHFHVLFDAPGGVASDAWASCAPTTWTAGEGLIAAVSVPPGIAARPNWTARVIVSRDTHSWYRPHLGALVLETAKELVGSYVVLPLGAHQGPGLAAPTAADLASAAIALPLR